ncbi:dihydroorotase [Flavobacteriales bacterium]|nr:dihydroorotase [Flavobacteriales bacterium]
MKNTKLLKSAKIIQPSSSFHLQSKDILITDGIITQIEDNIPAKPEYETIEHDNLHVSAGWIDIKANLREPGEEWKETLESGSKAAKFGGFTQVIVSPATQQPIDSSNRVEFIVNKSSKLPITISPLGTLSDKHEGNELSEMYEMSQAGALAFTDDKSDVNTGLMSKALLYSKNINKLIISFPNDKYLSNKGQMHEGEISTKMGLKGIPTLSEELRISRDLSLANYNNSPIHFSCISSAKSVELIKQAKQNGTKVTCDIAAHQLFFTDESTKEFDSNYKVLPPFRTQSDIEALISGLKEGTIDAICSDHTPHDIESKELEFDLADFGIIGLETAFASANSILKDKLSLEAIIDKMTVTPREILGISLPAIKEGHKAELTYFNPFEKWTFEKKDIKSKSKNTPFIGTEFTGKALGVIC